MKMIDKYIQENYGDYDERTKWLLTRVYEDCNKNNEKLSNYFFVCLDLLATQCKLYYFALDVIKNATELSSKDNYGRVAKHPALQVLNSAHKEILNILQKLSLSPFEIAKLKRLNKGEDDGSAEELLSELIK